jgi:hypothetical protein
MGLSSSTDQRSPLSPEAVSGVRFRPWPLPALNWPIVAPGSGAPPSLDLPRVANEERRRLPGGRAATGNEVEHGIHGSR